MKSLPIRDELRPPSNQLLDTVASSRLSAKAVDSGALFAGGNELVITHGAEVYRLRLTRQNRLILTK